MVAWWTLPLTFSLLDMSTLSTNSPHPQWFKSIIWFGQTKWGCQVQQGVKGTSSLNGFLACVYGIKAGPVSS